MWGSGYCIDLSIFPVSGPFLPYLPVPSESILSFHRNLGLPLGCFISAIALMLPYMIKHRLPSWLICNRPFSDLFSISSLRHLCPNHSISLLLLMTIAIGSTLNCFLQDLLSAMSQQAHTHCPLLLPFVCNLLV